ncbi:MAG: zinc ABC transporter substrate-binding protein [Thermoplasmata archaeon]|nr:zinc ABC transporter substrate-binding protein [Thermoplasmata archaeon]
MTNPTLGTPGTPGAPSDARGRSNRRRSILAIGLAAILVAGGTLVALHYYHPSPGSKQTGGVIPVVAAENFWGSLIAQLGGVHVSVTSVVSDPNADPHEYESNTSDAIAIANAQLVIENGAGYDDWCSQLVAASASPHQVILNVATLLGKVAGDNPHFWYGASYVNATIAAMYSDLLSVDATDHTYYQQQYAALNASLVPVWAREAEIRGQFHGTNVSSTESIFEYMANSTGLNLISPPEFMRAVAEGNDPPTASITEFQNQLESGNVSVLVYNLQTVTPLTQQMKTIATQHNVSVIGVTETIQPPDVSFEIWMEGELLTLQNALNQKALGH